MSAGSCTRTPHRPRRSGRPLPDTRPLSRTGASSSSPRRGSWARNTRPSTSSTTSTACTRRARCDCSISSSRARRGASRHRVRGGGAHTEGSMNILVPTAAGVACLCGDYLRPSERIVDPYHVGSTATGRRRATTHDETSGEGRDQEGAEQRHVSPHGSRLTGAHRARPVAARLSKEACPARRFRSSTGPRAGRTSRAWRRRLAASLGLIELAPFHDASSRIRLGPPISRPGRWVDGRSEHGGRRDGCPHADLRGAGIAAFGDGTDVVVVGGGTIVVPDLTYRRLEPKRLSCSERAGLSGVGTEGSRVTIGATTPVQELVGMAAPLGPCAANVADKIRWRADRGRQHLRGRGERPPHGDLQGTFLALGATVRSAADGEVAEEPLRFPPEASASGSCSASASTSPPQERIAAR